jgi:hypothetical protein
VLQIEDIRRLERIEVLPIPISPSAIVKQAAFCRSPERLLEPMASLYQMGHDSFAAQVNGLGKPHVKGFAILSLQIALNHP